jgi:hypothetical protein
MWFVFTPLPLLVFCPLVPSASIIFCEVTWSLLTDAKAIEERSATNMKTLARRDALRIEVSSLRIVVECEYPSFVSSLLHSQRTAIPSSLEDADQLQQQ